MHSNTVPFFDIAVIRASWIALLFLMSDPANKTCIIFCPLYGQNSSIHQILQVALKKVWPLLWWMELTAHLVRFCCWSLLSCGLLRFINLWREHGKQGVEIIDQSWICGKLRDREMEVRTNLKSEKIGRLTNHFVILQAFCCKSSHCYNRQPGITVKGGMSAVYRQFP